MKQVMLVLVVTVIGLIACKDKKQPDVKEGTEQKTEAVIQDPSKDSASIRNVITDFYNWYTKNYTTFEKYHLYSGIKKKDAPPYKINWDEVEKYQKFLRDSVPQLGEAFIADQKHFFQQCDSAFKVDVEDDLPYGFDYDWYTNSQEDPQYLLDGITKGENWWDIVAKGDDAIVVIKGYPDQKGKQDPTTFISLTMKKENGQWKIAKIGDN